MNALETLEKREIKELLSKGWITHDAMWFAHALETVGIEQTNRINLSAVRSMAQIETHRLKKALGFTKLRVETFDELVDLLNGAMQLVVADFMRIDFTVPEKNVIRWQMEKGKCFAFKGISGLGAIDGYECGVLLRVRTWFEALPVDFTMTPEVRRCLMHTQGDCSGEFRFQLA